VTPINERLRFVESFLLFITMCYDGLRLRKDVFQTLCGGAGLDISRGRCPECCMARHEAYMLPFAAGYGPEAFVGAFETASEAQAACARDAHTRVGPDAHEVRQCLLQYVIREPGEVWDATLEARLAALKDGTAPAQHLHRL